MAPHAIAAPVADHNLVDLIAQSESILTGTVETVTDGFMQNDIPYTEVRLTVNESLKGPGMGDYTFRQFGLAWPVGEKDVEYPGVSQQGFVHWNSGESVLVFLNKPAHLTGLQTTVGLEQGKLLRVDDQFKSEEKLARLFDNLIIEAQDLTSEQQAMLDNTTLQVSASPLLALLRRAVDERWIENGVMRRAN